MKRIKKIWSCTFIIIGWMLLLTSSCKKDDSASVPVLTTTDLLSISSISLVGGGNISSDGGSAITSGGICWSKSQGPTIADNKTIDSVAIGNFVSTISNLTPNTVYYLRAYTTNSIGTSYGNEIRVTTNSTVTDIDGNVYNTVTIGTQVWMAENLKTTKFNDGKSIPLVTEDKDWINRVAPGYCWCNNDSLRNKFYGALYNFDAVLSGKLCPIGWHVPTDAEWTTLTTYLEGENKAGSMLKETGTSNWASPNYGANNYSSFSALPGGSRGIQFVGFGFIGYWWSSTLDSNNFAIYRAIYWDNAKLERNGVLGSSSANSVRCIKD